jgi:hypothetical protein
METFPAHLILLFVLLFRQNLIMEHLNIPQPEKMADRGSIRPVMG